MTVGLIGLFFKRSLVELLQTESADEVFRVELPEHGRYASAGDGLVATRAQGASLSVIVGLAIRLAFVIKERSSDKRSPAIL